MKKSEHLKKHLDALAVERDRIQTEIEASQRELVAAMNEESPFKPGDKVRFKNYDDGDWHTGIWGRYELKKYYYPRPTIFKILPDGTQSNKIHWVGSDPEIIPA